MQGTDIQNYVSSIVINFPLFPDYYTSHHKHLIFLVWQGLEIGNIHFQHILICVKYVLLKFTIYYRNIKRPQVLQDLIYIGFAQINKPEVLILLGPNLAIHKLK